MLLATLPPIYREDLLEEVIAHPKVGAVRYNTGIRHDLPARKILREILKLTERHKKPPCIPDLKGRQLRVTEWSQPPYGPIRLNHRIEVELPAKVYFRNDDPGLIKEIDGNEIYVDPPPKYTVGAGQSVNIVAPDLKIMDGYFLERDVEFIMAAKELGLDHFLFSFTEFKEDLELFDSVLSEYGINDAKKFLKIESQNGMDLVRDLAELPAGFNLMAARDDLTIHLGGIGATGASREIVRKDPEAICASRLLLGLEQCGEVTLADISDIGYMQSFGYKNFMLSDGISHRHFRKAMEFWTEYIES